LLTPRAGQRLAKRQAGSAGSRVAHPGCILGAVTQKTERLNTALAGRYRIERHLGEGGMATV
jgi:hypothetical protein